MLKVFLIASGTKMPEWVYTACQVYLFRLQEYCQFKLIEVSIEKRLKTNNKADLIEKEAARIKQHIPTNCYIVALDSNGTKFSSIKLAQKLENIQLKTSRICFIIGGPDGISSDLLKIANETWSLSDLTFSHHLVRVVILETLYRSFSIIHKHPYHR